VSACLLLILSLDIVDKIFECIVQGGVILSPKHLALFVQEPLDLDEVLFHIGERDLRGRHRLGNVLSHDGLEPIHILDTR
jgi:hypothetical protein